jgi:hypothetical protein
MHVTLHINGLLIGSNVERIVVTLDIRGQMSWFGAALYIDLAMSGKDVRSPDVQYFVQTEDFDLGNVNLAILSVFLTSFSFNSNWYSS